MKPRMKARDPKTSCIDSGKQDKKALVDKPVSHADAPYIS